MAIVGRPNVGKSTLFNRLVGEERAVVHDAPGTTRDTIDTVVETEDGWLRFVDTAGMRRKSRIDEGTEYYSLVRALQAIDRSDAALLVIDATEGVTHQDQRLAERIDASGCAVVVVLNKWDVLSPDDRDDVLVDVADRLAFLSYAPVLKTSALTGRNVTRLLPALFQAREEYHRRVPTRALNEALQAAQLAHPPPAERGHRPRILYATQGATDPPTFTLFTTPGAAGQLPALPGAEDPGGVLDRADADQAPGASSGVTTRSSLIPRRLRASLPLGGGERDAVLPAVELPAGPRAAGGPGGAAARGGHRGVPAGEGHHDGAEEHRHAAEEDQAAGAVAGLAELSAAAAPAERGLWPSVEPGSRRRRLPGAAVPVTGSSPRPPGSVVGGPPRRAASPTLATGLGAEAPPAAIGAGAMVARRASSRSGLPAGPTG